jgi:hypothetical protein
MATVPPAPPKPAPEPTIKVPKLGRLQRNALNGAVESTVEWLEANGAAVVFQGHKVIRVWVEPVVPWLHKGVDDGLAWVIAKLATLKF